MLCSDQLSPKAVEALKDRRVVAIAGGWRHTAAADDAGNLYTWGWNKVRELIILHLLQQSQSSIIYERMTSSKHTTWADCGYLLYTCGETLLI